MLVKLTEGGKLFLLLPQSDLGRESKTNAGEKITYIKIQ
jgi:hypothetical protein